MSNLFDTMGGGVGLSNLFEMKLRGVKFNTPSWSGEIRTFKFI